MANKLYSKGRTEALTDGVFAIAMTLLVLDISVDKIGSINSNEQLINAMAGNFGSNLISFFISFLLLGSMWAIHARQFESIKLIDKRMMMINNLRLLAVVLIPFTASLSGTYPNIILANVLFSLNFSVLIIISSWQWTYATSKPAFYDSKQLSKLAIQKLQHKNYVFVFASVVVTILSIFIGSWAFLLFIPVSLVWAKIASIQK